MLFISFAALDFSNCNWIWTNELPSPGGNVLPGPRAFRRTIPTPDKLTPISAKILITCDNVYTVFVNGIKAGEGNYFPTAQVYDVPLHSKHCTVIAVYAVNVQLNPPAPGNLGRPSIMTRFPSISTGRLSTMGTGLMLLPRALTVVVLGVSSNCLREIVNAPGLWAQ